MKKSLCFAATFSIACLVGASSAGAMIIVPKTLDFSQTLVSNDVLTPSQMDYVLHEPWVNPVFAEAPSETADVTDEADPLD